MTLAKLKAAWMADPEFRAEYDALAGVYSPVARAAEKRASRERDARRLASGEVTREQLARENSFLPPEFMARLVIDYDGAESLV